MKRSLLNKLKLGAMAVLMAGNIYVSKAQDVPDNINTYGSIEQAATTDDNSRVRALTGLSYPEKDFVIRYNGLNQINLGNGIENYLGMNRFKAGKKGSKTKAFLNTKTFATEGKTVFKAYVGLSNSGLMKKLGADYGFATAATSKDEFQHLGFAGKDFGDASVEAFYNLTVPYSGEPMFYSELQANKDITDNLDAFVRMENTNFSKENTTFLMGFRYDL